MLTQSDWITGLGFQAGLQGSLVTSSEGGFVKEAGAESLRPGLRIVAKSFPLWSIPGLGRPLAGLGRGPGLEVADTSPD